VILVQYLPDRNVLCVTGVATPFPAGSLEARRQGDMLAVASPHEDYLLTQWTVFSRWIRPNGQPFTSTDEAFAYLDATCREKRPVGLPPITFTAGEPLSGHRAVRLAGSGTVRVASADDIAQAGLVAGVTLHAAEEGEPVAVAIVGEVVEPSWSFAPGPVFLGLNGALVQAPPASGFVQPMGTAITPTRLIVERGAPIILAQ
jgi:hypothetical protein